MDRSKKRHRQPYDFIEEWWGEPLGAELLDRIESAPNDQLLAFDDDYAFESNLKWLPEIPDGHLRPILRSMSAPNALTSGIPFSTALNILLYSHELILDDPIGIKEYDESVLLKRLRRGFVDLWALKPFADSGIVYFGSVSSMSRHPSNMSVASQYLDDVHFTDPNPEAIVECVAGGIFLVRQFDGRAHPMAYGRQEFEVMASLLRRTSIDQRYLDLTTLASLNLPRIEGRASELVAVRRSNEDFALWRDALSRALSQIEKISENDESWQADAIAVMHAELTPLRERLQRATKRSPALAALQAGVSGISIGGLGILAGWAVGGGFVPEPDFFWHSNGIDRCEIICESCQG